MQGITRESDITEYNNKKAMMILKCCACCGQEHFQEHIKTYRYDLVLKKRLEKLALRESDGLHKTGIRYNKETNTKGWFCLSSI